MLILSCLTLLSLFGLYRSLKGHSAEELDAAANLPFADDPQAMWRLAAAESRRLVA